LYEEVLRRRDKNEERNRYSTWIETRRREEREDRKNVNKMTRKMN
jgi:hypothetical protein